MKVLEDNTLFGFVILHYNSIDDTTRCVNSILSKLGQSQLEIIIVDNCSPNGTGIELEKKYRNENRINVLLMDENLGFAKGNNVGYRFARNQLDCTYICMMNNDTEIIQDDFISKITESYAEDKFAVLGPQILLNNDIINPLILELPKVDRLKRDYRDLRIMRILNKMNLLQIVYQLKDSVLKTEVHNEEDVFVYQKNIVLHGCCWIFSPLYISAFEGLDEKTFMFCEEELLLLQIKRKGMTNIYNPQVKIRHYEDGATNHTFSTYRKKEDFILKNKILSTKVLLDELRKF